VNVSKRIVLRIVEIDFGESSNLRVTRTSAYPVTTPSVLV
jgi:hypothetical protein